jgi:hypothetical protein
MHVLGATQVQQHRTQLQRFKELAEQAAETSPDMRKPELHSARQFVGAADRRSDNNAQVQLSEHGPSALDRDALKDAGTLSRDRLIQKYGCTIADRAIEASKSQAPTLKQILGKRQRMRRAADAECGKAMAAAGIQIQKHSVRDYTHVIVTQLNLLQEGVSASISAVVNAAFPDDPTKATSIRNSRHGNRRKQAYNSDAVRSHPMEKAMQMTHGRGSMNRRHTAGTFGQSLGINHTMFKSYDRIAKLEASVQLLEQKMQSTKQREALADAGCTTSREKVLALYDQGKRQTEIARLLDMPLNTVKAILRRSKEG